jgi:HEAT repeat protein
VRAQAAWALGRVGHDQAVPALSACLTDRAWWVRRHAAYALAALGGRGAETLRLAAHDGADRYARDIADEALRSLARGG